VDHRHIPSSRRLAAEAPVRGFLFYVRGTGTQRVLEAEGDAEGSLGRSLSAVRGDPLLWSRLLHRDDRVRVAEATASLGDGWDATVDYRVGTPDGGIRWIRDTFRLRPGRPHQVVGVLRDVTAERSLAEQVAGLEDRAWRSQRMEALGALAAGVAHDFNNLLTTILTSAHLLGDDEELSRQGRSDLALILEAATRGSRIVRQILRFARRGRDFSTAEVDVGPTVEDLRPIMERSLGVDHALTVRAEGDLPAVRCDPAQLEQVLLNLVVNARDAMPDGGTVDVAVEREEPDEAVSAEGRVLPAGSYVVLRVRDTGVGMGDGVRERIFEPFFTTKEGESGSGVGLSTVRRIVAGYGGGVTVDSEPGRGTTFGIWLPVAARATGVLPGVARTGRRGSRILVVEGDPDLRRETLRTLGADGHVVVAAESATEALRLFDRSGPPFELAIVDSVLPDRQGRELLGALVRRAPRLARMVLERGGGPASSPAGNEVVVLRAPFTSEELRAAVARATDDDGPTRAYQPSAVQ
jgi:signal transduction histidine kinase/CheY-like chemotaxis protein